MLLLTCLTAVPLGALAQEWITVDATDRPITVEASGIVASADALRFGPPPSRSWRISITQLAAEGSRVAEGDVLAKFDASASDDRVRALTAELNAKRSELESLLETQAREIEEEIVDLEAARSEADKASRKADVNEEVYASLEYQKLLEQKRLALALHESMKERVVLTDRVRRGRKAELEADVTRLESELSGAQQELDSFTIRAPRDGLVIIGTDHQGQKLDANDAVNPGMVVMELASTDDLMIQAEVPEFAAARIAVGQSAEVVIDAAGGTEVRGEVTDVARIVRRQSQFSQALVRDVRITLPESAIADLRPGMSAKVTLQIETVRGALAVPESALRYREGMPGLEVKGQGWTPVTLGPASDGQRIVSAGLNSGAEVAL
ncbi:MAG: efflux RND transporter periplasmic adaptor subunit [Pseudomonadota bacterium]